MFWFVRGFTVNFLGLVGENNRKPAKASPRRGSGAILKIVLAFFSLRKPPSSDDMTGSEVIAVMKLVFIGPKKLYSG